MSYLPLLKFLTPSLRLFLARSLLTNPQPLRLQIRIATAASTTNASSLLILFKIAPPLVVSCYWLVIRPGKRPYHRHAQLLTFTLSNSLQVIDLKSYRGRTGTLDHVYHSHDIAVRLCLRAFDKHGLVGPLIQ